MKASVIVPLYNCEKYLPKLWNSIKSQNTDLKQLEFIFVDNKSTDNSLKVLNSIANSNQTPQIKILSENLIQSSYAARNKGIKNSSAEIIIMLDADCIADTSWISEIIRSFELNPSIDIVAGGIESFESKNVLQEFAENHSFLSQEHTLSNQNMPYGQTANLSIRKSVFKKLGLFRPHLKSGGDADICWRYLKEYKKEIFYAKDAKVFHIHRTSLRGLYEQWYRYGGSQKYLQELYNINSRKISSPLFYLKNLCIWSLIEIPKAILCAKGKLSFVNTPLKLLCIYFQDKGYLEAEYKNEFAEIEQYSEEI